MNSIIKSFVFGPFAENTYVIHQKENREAIIFDAGCSQQREEEQLKQYLKDNQLLPVVLINTHAHIDHILGNAFVYREYGLLPQMHEKELFNLNASPMVAQMYGIPYQPSPEPSTFLNPGELLHLAGLSFKMLFTPGHSAGSISFYNEAEQYVIAGDVLFKRSIGRTDLPGGDFDTLYNSIHTELFVLPDGVKVYNGHGEPTTIGEEKEQNPFVGRLANRYS
jgi:hydroxyacylglutathione hydrolase